MRQLASILRERRTSDAPALVAGSETLSYAQAWEAVSSTRRRLEELGVRPGHKVVVALGNSPAFAIVLMALSELGAVSIPLNPALSEADRTRILGIAQPDFQAAAAGDHPLVAGCSLSPMASDGQPDPELADTSTIIFTSGTTGTPKGVVLSGDAMLANARAVVEYLELTAADRTLIFLPLFYSYPLSQLLTTWMAGGTVVLMKNLQFPNQAITLIDEHAITGFGGVPTSLHLLAGQAQGPRRSPRYLMNAGGPLSPALIAKIAAAFPSAALFNNYGCTEIAPRATAINYAAHPDRIGSIGRAIRGVTVRVVRPDLSESVPGETGEIVLNGPTLMQGYYRDPRTTASRMSAHGFHTGDFGYADEDGFLYFQGRRDDIFKCGGEKVSAREIEEVLLEHPGVLEAAVVAEPDDLLGQAPVAYVVPRGTPPDQVELQRFCRAKLSLHKAPRAVHFVDRLQRTDSGKVQKFHLHGASL